MEREVNSIIEKGKKIKIEIGKMTSSYKYPSDKKSMILMAYHSLIAEHHTSIHSLIQRKLYGSSFALVRSLYEALYRAQWLYGCATNAQIDRFLKDKNVFPKMKEMVEEIDETYGTGGFWKLIKDNSWTAMNDYTHSGVLQVGCRFKDDEIVPDYDMDAIIEVLNSTNMAVLLISVFFFHSFGKTKDAKEVEKMICEYNPEET